MTENDVMMNYGDLVETISQKPNNSEMTVIKINPNDIVKKRGRKARSESESVKNITNCIILTMILSEDNPLRSLMFDKLNNKNVSIIKNITKNTKYIIYDDSGTEFIKNKIKNSKIPVYSPDNVDDLIKLIN